MQRMRWAVASVVPPELSPPYLKAQSSQLAVLNAEIEPLLPIPLHHPAHAWPPVGAGASRGGVLPDLPPAFGDEDPVVLRLAAELHPSEHGETDLCNLQLRGVVDAKPPFGLSVRAERDGGGQAHAVGQPVGAW